MSDRPIEFYNRYTGEIEVEAVYGGSALKFLYGSTLGRIGLWAMVCRVWFSRFYGWLMDRGSSRKKIQPFIKEYGVDVETFKEGVESFNTFNEFFYRELKAEARPINGGEEVVVFPADGRHMGFQNVNELNGVFVKNQRFDIGGLLGDKAEAKKYKEGTFILSRLCPVDYHRFHFPVEGVAEESKILNGNLYSVNPMALRQNLKILSENKRSKTIINTKSFGRVIMLEIGATCVGSIIQTYKTGGVAKGEEKGYFKFGGSSTIILFEPGKVKLSEDLREQSAQGRELYAMMGDNMAELIRQ